MFHIVDCSNQIKSQTKAFTTVAIAFTQNAKDFQLANNIFNQNTFS